MTGQSSAARALAYAEEILKVHEVYESAKAVHAKFDDTLTVLSNLRDEKRAVETHLVDCEMDIAASERSKHPEMSATAMEKHLKIALHGNEQVRKLRDKIVTLTSDIEGIEYDRASQETEIRILTARMTELGGYLNYLAAIKQSQRTKA